MRYDVGAFAVAAPRTHLTALANLSPPLFSFVRGGEERRDERRNEL
jgi:hypothetical protein